MSWAPSIAVPSGFVRVDPKHVANAFVCDETGAITVDWVVLTAALVGLGLATAAVVSAGVENVSDETAAELADTPISTRFSTARSLFDSDFSGGLGSWLGGSAVSLAGFGDVLRLDGGETAELTLSVPPGAESAVIEFDLIAGDDLDGGDTATIMINGEAVSVYEDDHGNITVSGTAPDGVSVSVNHQNVNDPLGAGGHGHDSVSTYTITVDNPGTSLTLGVNSGANGPTSEEFYALDNVNVTSR